jgi:TetR/AcrR family tetracycline transcriptional repressor
MRQQAHVVARSSQAPATRRPGSRASRGTVSREDIVLAAVKVVDAGGYERLTIRGLAAGLGVAPMSLYRHIRDKDDLLDEVVDRLLAPAWRPAAAVDDWQAWVIEAATKLRHFLVTQPAALHVYLRHPVVSPAAIERMVAMMDVLRRTGADEQTARRAYGAVHTYTIGFAALEASRARGTSGSTDASDLARQLAAYTTAGQFIDGLRYLLDGIGRHTGTGLAPERQPRMRRHNFSALVMLDPVAPEDAAQCESGGTRADCPLEPGCYTYYPAVISLDDERPARTSVRALVTIALGDGETRAFFAPGQRFTIWADAVVGDTIRACGLVGYGVIAQLVSRPAPRAPRDEAAASSAGPARTPVPGGGYAIRSVIAVSAGCAAERRGRAGQTVTSGSPALCRGHGADREPAASVRKIKASSRTDAAAHRQDGQHLRAVHPPKDHPA